VFPVEVLGLVNLAAIRELIGRDEVERFQIKQLSQGSSTMAQHESKAQKKTVKRVMHEYKHGELPRGRGGKVKSRKQAIAIALHEAGASKYESPKKNRASLRKTNSKERRGETGQARSEGRKSATRTTASRKSPARKTARKSAARKSASRKTSRKSTSRKRRG
jgi:hypothetical protein